MEFGLHNVSSSYHNETACMRTPAPDGTSRTFSNICFREIDLLSRKTCFSLRASLSLDFVVRPYSLCDPGFIHSRLPPDRFSCSMNHIATPLAAVGCGAVKSRERMRLRGRIWSQRSVVVLGRSSAKELIALGGRLGFYGERRSMSRQSLAHRGCH
jgi:hypothetical protein